MLVEVKKKFRQLSQRWEKKAIVLCYHRIADETVDPWNISVSPKHFDEQLQVLAKDFTVVGINDLIKDFDKVAKRKTVCISFDDGYTDNYATARPLLTKFNLPACFFVASSFLGTEQLYWWDELAEIILIAPVLPSFLSLQINRKTFSFELNDNAVLSAADKEKIEAWKYYQRAPNQRCVLFLKLWEILRPLEATEQKTIMEQLRSWCGHFQRPSDAEKLPMTESRLRELAQDSLFTVGLHTLHHTALGYHPIALQEQEILENQSHLQKILKTTVDLISFPYGSYNSDSVELVNRFRLKASFTSEKRIMKSPINGYQFGRFAVKDWDGNIFKSKLNEWFLKIL